MEEITKNETNNEITSEQTVRENTQDTKPQRRPNKPYYKQNREFKEQNGETTLENNSIDEQNPNKKPHFKKKKPNKPKFINKDMPTSGDGWTNDLKKSYMINQFQFPFFFSLIFQPYFRH